jgi:hypothetical protein
LKLLSTGVAALAIFFAFDASAIHGNNAQTQGALLIGFNASDFGQERTQVNLAEVGVSAQPMAGLGLGVALGAEFVPPYGGLYFELGFEFRPLHLGDWRVYRWFDPYLRLDLLIGGGLGEGAQFRGDGVVIADVDIAIVPLDKKRQIAWVSQYRRYAGWSPDGLPSSYLIFGVAFRELE